MRGDDRARSLAELYSNQPARVGPSHQPLRGADRPGWQAPRSRRI